MAFYRLMAIFWLMALYGLMALYRLMALYGLMALYRLMALFRRETKAALIPVDHPIDHANMTSGSVTELLVMGHCD
jgi:hypothetical protein